MFFFDFDLLDSLDSEDIFLVGVFIFFMDCYFFICLCDSFCYFINCFRRLEQMKRLNMKLEFGLNRKFSCESLVDVKEIGILWIYLVL